MQLIRVDHKTIDADKIAWTERTERNIAHSTGVLIPVPVLQIHFAGGGGLELQNREVTDFERQLFDLQTWADHREDASCQRPPF